VTIENSAPLLEAGMQRVHARGRTAEALLGIALDVIEPFASDYLSPADYKRLCDRVAGPVSAAAQAALATLVDELEAARLVDDRDVLDRLSRPASLLAVAAE
jgi:hypothetical protein